MNLITATLLLLALHIANGSLLQRQRWANAAFNYIQNINCSLELSLGVANQAQCYYLKAVRKADVVVYTAETSTRARRLRTVLPDGPLVRESHAAVIALDPYPNANHGHLIVVFFIDYISAGDACSGTRIGTDECLQLAVKRRCHNAIERNSGEVRSARIMRRLSRRCAVNFIPHVYDTTDPEPRVIEGISEGYTQRLMCREDLLQYALCPDTRPANETGELICNPIRDNTRSCETPNQFTRCPMFESCDHAVLISGGWNAQHSFTRHKTNIIDMYHLVRRNGFRSQNVKLFYANGMSQPLLEEDGEEAESVDVFPAAMKSTMSGHIRRLCTTPHCVDSLLIYLNNPVLNEGTNLLWDLNHNGKADDDERYSIQELLADIENCQAENVQIIADQSFSGLLTKALRKSDHHANVMAFASSKEHEYSYSSLFTSYWKQADHSHTCSQQVFQAARDGILLSTPDLFVPSGSTFGPVTIFGAPCNVQPQFTQHELKIYHKGCQNVPTEIWLRTFYAASPHYNAG